MATLYLEGGAHHVAAQRDRGPGGARDVPAVDLVGDDGRLVDDDVHEVEDVGARLEVEQLGGVPVDDAALGKDLDLHARRRRHDLRHDLHVHLDRALLNLKGEEEDKIQASSDTATPSGHREVSL